MKLASKLLPIFNMGVRLAGLVGKFALSIYLAKFFSLEIVGVYGLIMGVAAVLPPLIGFGLNYYLNRETIGLSPVASGPMIRDRLVVTTTGLAATGVVALLYVLTTNPTYMPMYLAIAPIIAIEAYFFDIQLSLFSLRMPLLANSLLVIRTAAWSMPFILLSYFYPHHRTLSFLLLWWILGQLTSIALLAFQLRDWPWRQILRVPIDHAWIRSRAASAKRIFLGDIGLAGYAYLDRFMVAAIIGLEGTGIYVFLLSIASGLQVLVTSGIIQISLPHLVETYKLKGHPEWRNLLMKLTLRVVGLGAIGGAILFIGTAALLPWIHRPGLRDHLLLLAAMLIGVIVRLVSDLMNYGLYSRRQDRALASLNIVGLGLTIVYTVIGLHLFGLSGMAFSLIATPVTMLILRLSFLFPRRLPLAQAWFEAYSPPAMPGWGQPGDLAG